MKYIKLLLLLLTAVLTAACEADKTPSFQKGNPYSKEFYGIKGAVKYALYNNYKNGYVEKSIRLDFSTEGVLTKKKVFESGDSIVLSYSYDPQNNIQHISGAPITFYKNQFTKGMLTKEWLYTDKTRKTGYTLRYKVNGETLIKKENVLPSGAGVTTTYIYTTQGIIQEKTKMLNDGSYTVNIYDDENHLTSIAHYNSRNRILYTEDITTEYDEYDNLVKYSAKKDGKVNTYYKVVYKYYTDDELKSAQQQTKSAITSNKSFDAYEHTEVAAPNAWLLATIIFLSLAFLFIYLYIGKNKGLFKNFGGHVEEDGRRKMWMYNSLPYIKMGFIFGSMIAAFLSSIVILLLFGGAVWLLFWAVKLILWATIIGGWLLLAGGIIATFGKKRLGILAAIVGGIIMVNQNTLQKWGEQFAVWGNKFMDNVDALDWAISVFANYGPTMLMIVAIPMVCFLALAVLLIIVSYLLRIYEHVALKIYNVNRPCPVCGNTHDFAYMIGREEYPIPLHPGLYGVLHQTNHDTGMRLPTMLLNGKAKLPRKCLKCGEIINRKEENVYGTDIHIGIVGTRSSGKSYMLFSGLELLQQEFGNALQQIDTDNNQVEIFVQRIHNKEGIQTADKNRYKAIQFRLTRKHRPIPYHLFWYDVAGEKFNARSNSSQEALKFYTNVKTIVFVIDPTMTDTEQVTPSKAFAEWLKAHGNPTEKYEAEGTLGRLKEIITQQAGRKTKDIDLLIVCTKKDLGYLENSNYPYTLDDNMVKKFICEEIGLSNLINSTSDFKSVGYATVSAIDKERKDLHQLFLRILKQRGITS